MRRVADQHVSVKEQYTGKIVDGEVKQARGGKRAEAIRGDLGGC
jgi:hypothetical protein